MKKKILIALFAMLPAILFFDLFRNRKVKLYEEYEVYSEREVLGLAWLIISSPEQAAALENKQGVVFPSVDFSKETLNNPKADYSVLTIKPAIS